MAEARDPDSWGPPLVGGVTICSRTCFPFPDRRATCLPEGAREYTLQHGNFETRPERQSEKIVGFLKRFVQQNGPAGSAHHGSGRQQPNGSVFADRSVRAVCGDSFWRCLTLECCSRWRQPKLKPSPSWCAGHAFASSSAAWRQRGRVSGSRSMTHSVARLFPRSQETAGWRSACGPREGCP